MNYPTIFFKQAKYYPYMIITNSNKQKYYQLVPKADFVGNEFEKHWQWQEYTSPNTLIAALQTQLTTLSSDFTLHINNSTVHFTGAEKATLLAQVAALINLLPLPTDISKQYNYKPSTGWVEATGGGASTFVALTDTPANYTGQGDKNVVVKADETGLEFQTKPTIPTKTSDLANDSNFITGADVPVNETDPIFSASEAASFVAGDKNKLDSALQSGDNVSELVNDAGYITSAATDITDLTNSSTVETTITDTWYFQLWVTAKTWKVITYASLKTILDALYVAASKLIITAGKTLTVTDDTTLNGGTHSGTNSGDQVGDGVTITGAGTLADPFVAAGGAVTVDGITITGAGTAISPLVASTAGDLRRKITEVFDDFTDLLLPATVSGNYGTRYFSINGGGVRIAQATADNTRDGVFACETGTTASGIASIYLTGQSVYFGGGSIVAESSFNVPIIQTAAQDYLLNFGFKGTNNGFAIRVLYSTYSNTNFEMYTINPVTGITYVDTGLAMAANTWYTFRFEVSADGLTYKAFINGTQYGGDISGATAPYTNVPMNISNFMSKQVGTTNRISYWDYMFYQKIYS
jgi:hypothetical protein